jgi:nicotinate phosphoribosyltransferase
VIEFGTRRTHPAAAVDAARAAYAVGFAATSNVEAGRRFGVPISGTAAHMWTMAHDTEEEAFAGYVAVFPTASILLIDTYDTLRGAERAAKIAGEKLKGVRLDSGDLLELSRAVRVILDENGCTTAKIVASGDLNEVRIAELRAAGAPIDLYGVGTDLVTSLDAPALGGVYKLVELTQGGKKRPIAKFSEGKATLPGAHQVLRFHDAAGKIAHDMITLDGEPADPSWGAAPVPLLIPVMRGGKRVAPAEPLDAIRARAAASRASLPAELHLLAEPTPSWVGLAPSPSPRLSALVAEVRATYALPQKEPR